MLGLEEGRRREGTVSAEPVDVVRDTTGDGIPARVMENL